MSPGFSGARGRGSPRLLDAAGLWDYSLKILSGRALSIGEVRDKLRRRASEPEFVDQTLEKLREYGYLNDARFAENFAGIRKDSGSFGKMRVLRDLRQRRVHPQMAEEAVRDAFEGSDEVAMVEDFLARKYRKENLALYFQEPKHLQSAFRKLRYAGFGTAASIRVLKRYAAEAENLEIEPEPEATEN